MEHSRHWCWQAPTYHHLENVPTAEGRSHSRCGRDSQWLHALALPTIASREAGELQVHAQGIQRFPWITALMELQLLKFSEFELGSQVQSEGN